MHFLSVVAVIAAVQVLGGRASSGLIARFFNLSSRGFSIRYWNVLHVAESRQDVFVRSYSCTGRLVSTRYMAHGTDLNPGGGSRQMIELR